MGLDDMVKRWVLGIALKKGVLSLAKLIVSYCAAKGISFVGSVAGIPIDTSSILAITAAINSALKMLINWLKITYPDKFSWL